MANNNGEVREGTEAVSNSREMEAFDSLPRDLRRVIAAGVVKYGAAAANGLYWTFIAEGCDADEAVEAVEYIVREQDLRDLKRVNARLQRDHAFTFPCVLAGVTDPILPTTAHAYGDRPRRIRPGRSSLRIR